MAHYRTDATTPAAPERAFAWMADFTNAAIWDPGIRHVRRVDTGPVRVGSAFDVTLHYVGKDFTMHYEVVELDEPVHPQGLGRVVLRSETPVLTSIDTITVRPSGDGSVVTYEADLRLPGPLRLVDPLLAVGFRRVGDKAAEGLQTHLAALPLDKPNR